MTPTRRDNALREQGEVGTHNSRISPKRSDTTPKTQGRRLPAYGRDLVAMQHRGLTVPWLLISIGWLAGKALPRVVIADDQDVHGIDLTLVRGLDCMVTHHGEASRAFAVAELALKAGATRCPIFDMSTGRLEATTREVMVVRGMRAAA